MAGNLLNIGKTGLYAAQAGLATTGHNIANVNVPGYSRQQVIQSAAAAQNVGNGFIGSGTEISDIERFSDKFLNNQMRVAQSANSALASYNAQISQVDNLLADTTSGLSPSLQDFFKSVQDLSANASSAASRQNFLSSAESLAARFQGINGRLEEMRSGVNSEISSNVTLINSYATQIAALNDQIGTLTSSTGHPPNDMLDARDQLVLDLNKQVKATVVEGSNHSLTVSIGTGQPLVVGGKAFALAVTHAPDDPSRLGVGYVSGSKVTPIAESSLTGGELGGIMEFRANTLDNAQKSVGRIALSLGASFNAQNHLGQDGAGNMGGDLFNVTIPPGVNLNKSPADTTLPSAVTTTATDGSLLTTSDYAISYDATTTQFTVTRLSDKTAQTMPDTYTQPGPLSLTRDGLTFTVAGNPVAGDNFLVRPTINAAAGFSVAAKAVGDIAAAGPIMTAAAIANKGSAKPSEGSVDKRFLPETSFTPATLTFKGATNELQGFTTDQLVTVNVPATLNTPATTTVYTAGTAPVIPYVAGASYEFGGVTMSFTGQPVDNDQFTVARNAVGVGDNRNMLLMGALQATRQLDNGSATYQSAFAQLVSTVGNKAREVQVNGLASDAMLAQTTAAQQSVSGVNLDEEAANLLKYQQAYQAAGKVMQIASAMFDTLLSLGH
jgi:flagellar hook-associated protein 1 FlgK